MDMQEILAYSLTIKASDVLFSPGALPYFRVDGDLTTYKEFPILDSATIQTLLYNLMTDDQIKLLERSHALDIVFDFPNINCSFRSNIVKQENGLAIAFRLISNAKLTLDEIQAPKIIKNLLELSSGLIVITGPEGSGKSTTLSAMINYINSTQSKHIITIENPIEHKFKNEKSLIDQRQLFDKNSFSDALRIALRGNPDILVISEMQDRDTVRLALNAAETGQLVLSTLHSNSAPAAIRRMVDVFPSGEKQLIRNLISGVVQGVICQKLVKKIAGGRAAAFEVLIGNYATRNLIRKDDIEQLCNIMQLNKEIGMCTIKNSLEKMVEENIISGNEIPT